MILPGSIVALALVCAQLAPPPAPTSPAPRPPAASRPSKQRPYERPLPPVHPGCRVAFPDGWQWIQGTPVTQYMPGRTYFIEFFSTTCTHCAEAAPIVHDLHKAFAAKGIDFIAVTKEDAATITAWLEKRPEGERIEHPIVSDPTLSAERVLQYGTFTNATPRAFIVREGIVQWWGHPNKAEPVLSALAAGTWNPASIRDEFILESQTEQAKDLITAAIRKAEQSGDFTPVLTLIDQIVQQIPERTTPFLMQKFTVLIGIASNPEAGYALGRALAAKPPVDPSDLRTLARTTVNNPWVKQRDLDFALEMAKRAMEMQPDDPRSPEVMAMVLFARDDREGALANMERAIALQTDQTKLTQFKATLQRYKTAPTGPAPYSPPTKATAVQTPPPPTGSTPPKGSTPTPTPTPAPPPPPPGH